MRCPMDDTEQLLQLLDLFFAHERAEIADFRKAVEQFKADLPAVLEALRDDDRRRLARQRRISARRRTNSSSTPRTRSTRRSSEADVREMLIQHILTEEIFAKVFDEADFHRENNVANELYELEGKFFTGAVKQKTLKGARTLLRRHPRQPPRRSPAIPRSRPSSR